MTRSNWDWQWIEASAGTGKTYAITRKVVSLIADEGLKPDKLLVVTFTEKATAELKLRIREALGEAANEARRRGDERKLFRLETSLENVSHIGISTIHGFCQSLLAAFPIETGLAFDPEVVDQKISRRKRIVRLLRSRLHQLPADRLRIAALDNSADLEDALVQALEDGIFEQTTWYPNEIQLEAMERLFVQLQDKESSLWQTHQKMCEVYGTQIPDWRAFFTTEDVAQLHGGLVKKPFRLLRSLLYARNAEELIPLLNEETFAAMVKWDPEAEKSVYKKRLDVGSFSPRLQAAIQFGRDWLHELEPWTSLLGASLSEALRRCFAFRILKGLWTEFHNPATNEEKALWGENPRELTFDSMIDRVHRLLTQDGPSSRALLRATRERYDVALIDEFQDTDHRQWEIFRNIFDVPGKVLTVVGDPKQSIYGFRGADLGIYRQARKTFLSRGIIPTVLQENFRSTDAMVEAMNRVFAPLFEASEHPEDFTLSRKGEKPIAELVRFRDGKRELFEPVVWLDLGGPDRLSQNQQVLAWLRTITMNAVALLEGSVFLVSGETQRPLTPGDLLFLTDSNQQSQLLFRLLSEKGIPAVVSGTGGLFASQEAHDVLAFFKALEDPRNASSAKTLLLSRFFKRTTQSLTKTPHELEILQEALLEVQDERNRGSFLQAFRSVIGCFTPSEPEPGGLEDLLAQPLGGERSLTNTLHLLEFLQDAAQGGKMSVDRAAAFLERKIAGEGGREEEIDLRLDRDSPAARILTVHKAKGLESPVVLSCVGLTGFAKPPQWLSVGSGERKKVDFLVTTEGLEIWDLDRKEELRRLYYVAMTRAKTYQVLPGSAPKNSRWEWFLAQIEKPESRKTPFLSRTEFLDAVGYEVDQVQENPPTRRRLLLLSSDPRSRHPSLSSHTGLLRKSVRRTHFEGFREREAEGESPEIIDDGLPAGAEFGTLVHDLLEKLDFGLLNKTLASDNSAGRETLQRMIHDQVQRSSLILRGPQKTLLSELLERCLNDPIQLDGTSVVLSQLPMNQTRREIEFHLPLANDTIKTFPWKGLFKNSGNDFSLTVRPGFFTGRIDLLFEWKNKIYLLDWKTNRLDRRQTLESVMSDSSYDLQALWYWKALRFLCKTQQEPLAPGGVIYLFLRGPNGAPDSCFLTPETLQKPSPLDVLFSNEVLS